MTTSTLNEYWPAPRAFAPVQASVLVPASKSLTNRFLALAALTGDSAAGSETILHNPLASRDSDLMVAALQAMGVQFSTGADGSWRSAPARPPANRSASIAA